MPSEEESQDPIVTVEGEWIIVKIKLKNILHQVDKDTFRDFLSEFRANIKKKQAEKNESKATVNGQSSKQPEKKIKKREESEDRKDHLAKDDTKNKPPKDKVSEKKPIHRTSEDDKAKIKKKERRDSSGAENSPNQPNVSSSEGKSRDKDDVKPKKLMSEKSKADDAKSGSSKDDVRPKKLLSEKSKTDDAKSGSSKDKNKFKDEKAMSKEKSRKDLKREEESRKRKKSHSSTPSKSREFISDDSSGSSDDDSTPLKVSDAGRPNVNGHNPKKTKLFLDDLASSDMAKLKQKESPKKMVPSSKPKNKEKPRESSSLNPRRASSSVVDSSDSEAEGESTSATSINYKTFLNIVKTQQIHSFNQEVKIELRNILSSAALKDLSPEDQSTVKHFLEASSKENEKEVTVSSNVENDKSDKSDDENEIATNDDDGMND